MKLLSISIDLLLYAFTGLALIFFIVLAYQTNKQLILDSWINTVLFFGLATVASLFVFRLVVEAAAASLKEKMSLYEVILFVKTKRELEQLQKENTKIVVKENLLEKARQAVAELIGGNRTEETTAQSLPAENRQPQQQPQQPPQQPQQPPQQPQQPQPEQKPQQESPKEQPVEKHNIKPVGEQAEKEAERIREIFKEQFGELSNWPQIKSALDVFLSYFLKDPEASSLGTDWRGNELAEKLARISLLEHTRRVVEKTAGILAGKDNLYAPARVGALFGALLHDVGKLEPVWKSFTDKYESPKHGEYGSMLVKQLAEAGDLPELYDGFWNQVSLAVKNHHDQFKKKPDWIEVIREADYRARAEELKQVGESEAKLESLYKNVLGVEPFSKEQEADLDEIAKVISKEAAEQIKKMATAPVSAYLKQRERLLSMVAEGEVNDSLVPYLYVDKSALVFFILQRNKKLAEAAKPYSRDGNLQFDAKTQSEFLKYLEEFGIPRFEQTKVKFPPEAREKFKAGWMNDCDNCMILSRFDLKELNPECDSLMKAVQKRLAENSNPYFIGKAYDEGLDATIYVPTKEFVINN